MVANKEFNVHIVVESLRKKIMSQSATLSNPNLSLYLFCQNKLLSTSDSSPTDYLELGDLEEYKDPQDNFLYLTIA